MQLPLVRRLIESIIHGLLTPEGRATAKVGWPAQPGLGGPRAWLRMRRSHYDVHMYVPVLPSAGGRALPASPAFHVCIGIGRQCFCPSSHAHTYNASALRYTAPPPSDTHECAHTHARTHTHIHSPLGVCAAQKLFKEAAASLHGY
jgi:hypothetical protein